LKKDSFLVGTNYILKNTKRLETKFPAFFVFMIVVLPPNLSKGEELPPFGRVGVGFNL